MVTWRRVVADEAPVLDAWLAAHGRGPIFARTNLRDFGLDGDHPLAVTAWMAGDWQGVVAMTRSGMILPQLAGLSDLTGLRDALAGRTMTGLIGEAGQAQRVQQVIVPPDAAVLKHTTEPGFDLELDALVMPPTAGLRLAPIRAQDAVWLADWLVAYDLELALNTRERARALAAPTIDRWRADDSHRILWRGDEAVAMTGFNARLPDLVQVGGVNCRPAHRGQGYARAAVALHLAEARAVGVSRACLFAASDSAARAYVAIGFRPSGQVRLVLLSQAVTL